MKLRTKLVLALVSCTWVVAAVVGVLSYRATAQGLHDEVDSSLEAAMSGVAPALGAPVRVAPIDRDHAGENGFEPVTGFIGGVTRWHWPELMTALVVVVAIVAILRLREPVLTAIVATHVLLLSCLGTVVWMHWWGFGRVVLPLTVLALVGPKRPVPAPTPPVASPIDLRSTSAPASA